MPFDPFKHHRRSIRLKGYDYSQAGAYFITCCVQKRICLFGEIEHHVLSLNHAGRMIEKIWLELPDYYQNVETDAFVVMPNHFHGIVVLKNVGAGPRACPESQMTLPDIVHRFKSLTTTQYRKGVKSQNWEPFMGKLWQRNYYEHIVRNSDDLNRIREYIQNNPHNWISDDNNPTNQQS